MDRRSFVKRAGALVAAISAGGMTLAQQVSERVVRFTTALGPRGEQFIRDTRGGMWLVSRGPGGEWLYGADVTSQESFRRLVQGAKVFVDGIEWDIAHFPP